MDYAQQAKTENQVFSFTYFEYLKLKRKPTKLDVLLKVHENLTPHSTRPRIGVTVKFLTWLKFLTFNPPAYRRDSRRDEKFGAPNIQPTRV